MRMSTPSSVQSVLRPSVPAGSARASPSVRRTPPLVAPGETFVFGAREEAGQPEHSPKPWAEDQAEDRAYSTKKAKAFDDEHRAASYEGANIG